MKKHVVIVFILALADLLATSGGHTALAPREILRRADEARGNLQGVEWTVDIRSIEKGREQERSLDVKARGYDFLGVVLSPPRVKKQRVLMVDHNMWFAKPGVSKPVPISTRQKLIGGASYGDIAATNYADDYEATLLGQEVVGGESCDVFDLKARNEKATYDRIKYWISQERIVGVRAEYYTVSDKMFKSATFEYKHQIRLPSELRPFISKMTIIDALVPSDVTTLIFSKPALVTVPPSTLDVNLLTTR
jgi:outer membrane lipoprotein-sorting protein